MTERKWTNYGDVNYLEHGGYLVRPDERENCFEVISLSAPIHDYRGKYKYPCIVARCWVDTDSWMDDDYIETIARIRETMGMDYDPAADRARFAIDLVDYYGIAEFDPEFPKETGCGPYGFTWNKIIVGRTAARRFLKEHGVPPELRR